jgi:hypothetical protein
VSILTYRGLRIIKSFNAEYFHHSVNLQDFRQYRVTLQRNTNYGINLRHNVDLQDCACHNTHLYAYGYRDILSDIPRHQ